MNFTAWLAEKIFNLLNNATLRAVAAIQER